MKGRLIICFKILFYCMCNLFLCFCSLVILDIILIENVGKCYDMYFLLFIFICICNIEVL